MVMERVGIFGWAFNPPTLWHRRVIEEVLDKNIVTKIIICPDGKRDDKHYGISESHRRGMIVLFYENLKKDWLNVEIDMHFFDAPTTHFTTTFEVNAYFEKLLWHAPFHIFWSDIIKGIHTWSGNPKRFIETKLKKIFITRKWFALEWIENMKEYEVVEIESLEISSTQVRKLIHHNEKYTQLLEKNIATYIEKHRLYAD